MNAQPWDKRPDEPTLWYGRFTDYYLLAGPARSLDKAYQAFRASQQQARGAADSTQRKRNDDATARPDGGWTNASSKYRWHERAKAYDVEQARIARNDHIEHVKAQARKHRFLVTDAVNKLLKQSQSVAWDTIIDPRDYVRLLQAVVSLDRLINGSPDSVAVVEHRTGPEDPEARAAATAFVPAEIPPDYLASVVQILKAHEPEVGDAEGDGPGDGPHGTEPKAS